jgi:transcriptional regulator with XRE-family HTH domain
MQRRFVTSGRPIPDAKKMSRLRETRLRAGLTIDVLAVRAGISRATVALAEKVPEVMSDRTAKACAKVLGVRPEEVR